MDNLPTEIRHLICAHVCCKPSIHSSLPGILLTIGPGEGRRHGNLHNLSFLDHAWYKAAVPFIYERLVIKFFDYPSLARAVAELRETPTRQQYFAHARCLDLIALPPIQRPYIEDDGSTVTLRLPNARDRALSMVDFVPITVGPFVESDLTHKRELGLGRSMLEPGFYEEKQWEPIVLLLKELRHLNEVNYAMENMFPKCLLQVIHDRHPNCRLSVWGSHLLHLDEPGLEGLRSAFHRCGPFEMDLLRSPCLHGLSIFSHVAVKLPTQELICEPIFPLITMAPNLKHIQPWIATEDFEVLNRSNENWMTFINAMSPCYSAAPLSLAIRDSMLLPTLVQKWISSADCSQISRLKVDRPLNIMDFKLVISKRLKNVQDLAIDVSTLFIPPPDYENHLESVFEDLQPLKYLRITGTNNTRLMRKIFERHGETLQGFVIELTYRPDTEEFHIYPAFESKDLAMCAELCPHLSDLRIPLRRSKGGRWECELYETLARFSCLQGLVLDLDCDPDEQTPETSASTTKTGKLSVPEVLINAAMDETLACEIWDRIAANQPSKRLQRLRINDFGGMRRSPSVRNVLWHLSRSFLVTRTGTYDSPGRLVREIGHEEREELPLRVAKSEWRPVPKVSKYLQEFIGSLWPSSKNTDWKSSWKSWSLHSEAE